MGLCLELQIHPSIKFYKQILLTQVMIEIVVFFRIVAQNTHLHIKAIHVTSATLYFSTTLFLIILKLDLSLFDLSFRPFSFRPFRFRPFSFRPLDPAPKTRRRVVIIPSYYVSGPRGWGHPPPGLPPIQPGLSLAKARSRSGVSVINFRIFVL